MNDAGSSAHGISSRLTRSIGIPPRPALLERVSAEVLRPSVELGALADLIGTDVSLSAALLRAANSPLFGLNAQLASIAQALTVLGLGTVEVLVTEYALRATLTGSAAISMERFWDASQKIARVGRHLSRRLPGVDADEAYVFGLLRDSGIALMLQHFPDYKQVLAQANTAAERGFTELEQDRYETDHATVGYLLARSWHLPDHVCQGILQHHEYGALGDESEPLGESAKALIGTALVAERCVQLATGQARSVEWEKGGGTALAYLALSDVEFEELADDVLPLLGGR